MLNARMTQMAGQIIRPNQKILDSDSATCCFPDIYKNTRDILTVKSAVNNVRTNMVQEVKNQVRSTTK